MTSKNETVVIVWETIENGLANASLSRVSFSSISLPVVAAHVFGELAETDRSDLRFVCAIRARSIGIILDDASFKAWVSSQSPVALDELVLRRLRGGETGT